MTAAYGQRQVNVTSGYIYESSDGCVVMDCDSWPSVKRSHTDTPETSEDFNA